MILTCPACMTRYLVDPSALGTDGRRVRCARCQHTWHAEPPSDDLDLDDDMLAGPTGDRAPDDDEEAAEADEDVDVAATRRRAARAQLPAVREEKPGKLWTAWVVLLLVVVGLLAGAYVYRSQIVGIWPPAGKLYQTIGIKVEPPFTLLIPEFKTDTRTENGTLVLLVSGNVVNDGKFPQVIPQVQAILFDTNDRVLVSAQAPLAKSILQPGESLRFTAKVVDPPRVEVRVRVVFGPGR